MTAARRTAGRAAALAGRSWEIDLARWHDAYRRDGRACIQRAHPPVKHIRSLGGGQFVGVRDRTGPPDFWGTLPGGRAVVFDAKECSAARWPLKAVEPHQARDLEAHTRQGAVAFVALDFAGRGWVLPWDRLVEPYWMTVDGEARRGEASLTPADVALIGLPMGADGWLDVVRAHWGIR